MKLIFTEISPPEVPMEIALSPPILRQAIAGFHDAAGIYYERVIQESGREIWFRLENDPRCKMRRDA